MIRRLAHMRRRASARVVTSVVALALAVGAMGVFAIPAVSTSSLRESAERDGLAEIVIGTTDTGTSPVIDLVESLPDVEAAEPQIETVVAQVGGGTRTLVGLDLGRQHIDVVRPSAGRLPDAFGEVVVPAGVAEIGDSLTVERFDGEPVQLDVVGLGATSAWTGRDVVFTTLDTAADIAGLVGVNRVSITSSHASTRTTAAGLRDMADEVRELLAESGISMLSLPSIVPAGEHPIGAEIEQISLLIGLLGVVAGVVGLVLLASTTNTMIVERTREVAVMRALGASPRRVRRRLRRLALGIAAAAVVIGVPLGIAISNVIARLVMQEFVGSTPDVAVSVPVSLASAAFALVGARLVSARAARRVTRTPLASALRDRDGAPFGRRMSERIATRVQRGGLLARAAIRSGVQRRSRSMAIAAQIGAAIAALMIVASMATTINDFNEAEREPWRWASATSVAGPGLDIEADVVDDDPRSETAIAVEGATRGWQVDVYGFEPDTQMVDRRVVAGRWAASAEEVVVSAGFAARSGIDIGDTVEVSLASGEHRYDVVGLHANRGRELYLDRTALAVDLGASDRANRLFSLDAEPDVDLHGVVEIQRAIDLEQDDSGRAAILLIFGAIGLVVVSVAGLAVASGLAVSIHERRHEFAAIRAIGGRRRDVIGMLAVELSVYAVVGCGLGLVGGYVGGRAIARSFEASNAVEIGFVFATGAIPAVAATLIAGSMMLAVTAVRRAMRRSIAHTLRGAA